MKKKTLLVIYPGRNVTLDCVFALIVAETGEVLATHLCSHYGFAKGDLYENKTERIEEYTKRFGDIEVKFIDETDIMVGELLKRNKEWFAKIQNKTQNP